MPTAELAQRPSLGFFKPIAVSVVTVLVIAAVLVVSGGHLLNKPGRRLAASPGPLSSTVLNGESATWVQQENAKPGTTAWRLDPKKNNKHIEGFAGAVSAKQGDTVQLYITTDAPSYHVEAYRMGFYGGAQGRLIWTSPDQHGLVQAPPAISPKTHTVVANWKPSLEVSITNDWPPGDYLFKLVDARGDQHYIPLTIRDDSSTATYLIKNSVNTWQAYNLWGGYSLYSGIDGKGQSFNNRARIVSFDRPYEIGDGSGDYLGNEQPLVSLAESRGLNVTYTTDVDVSEHPDVLKKHQVLLSLGHDEYWNTAMRNGALAARDSGTNIIFFGANADYRHIRYAPSPHAADREEIDYKSAFEDPLNHVNNAEVTVDWRDPPTNEPESILNGNYYECNPVHASMKISQSDSWLFADTGVDNGTALDGLVGAEYDHYTPSAPHPTGVSGMEILAHSPVTCRGKSSFSDVTYYSAPNRGGVFDSGTSYWIPSLADGCPSHGICPSDVTRQATLNLLTTLGSGVGGNVAPMHDNSALINEDTKLPVAGVD